MFSGGHQSRPDRAEAALYVKPVCVDGQRIFCTVTPSGKPCRRLSVRPREQALPYRRHFVRSTTLPGRANNPLHGQAFDNFKLLIYWFQKSGITYPTLQMTKTCLQRRLFDDNNYVFWMGFGFKNSGCGGLRMGSKLRSGESSHAG